MTTTPVIGTDEDEVLSAPETTDVVFAGAGDDAINDTMGNTLGSIDGGEGFDTLNIFAFTFGLDYSGTTISNIEETNLIDNTPGSPLTFFIDAAQVENLGTVTATGLGEPLPPFTIALTASVDQIADFSGFVLADGQEIIVTQSSFVDPASFGAIFAGESTIVDFSGATFGAGAFLDYNGFSADDTVFGGSGNDELSGAFGDDTLVGNGGDDDIDGSSGDDSLDGGDGNDSLDGSLGNDTLSGGDGDDELSGDIGNDDIFAGAGDDTIVEVSNNFDSVIDGGEGNDTLILETGGSHSGSVFLGLEQTVIQTPGTIVFDSAQIPNLGAVVFQDEDGQPISGGAIAIGQSAGATTDFSQFTLSAGQELTVSQSSPADGATTGETTTVDFSGASFGEGAFVDYNGSSADETVIGGSGDDELSGGGGDDHLTGGDGGDTLLGGFGDDELIGGAGDDILNGNGGEDQLDGGDGNDQLTGGGSNSSLFGGDGDDELLATGGPVVLDGGAGFDTLNLNTLSSSGGLAGATISGIEQTLFDDAGNIIDASQIANLGIAIGAEGDTAINLTLSNPEEFDAAFVDFSDFIVQDSQILDVNVGSGLLAGSSFTVDFSSVTLGEGAFVDYSGSSANELIFGSTGDDVINVASGNDIYVVSAENNGDDTLFFFSGSASDAADTLDLSAFDLETVEEALANAQVFDVGEDGTDDTVIDFGEAGSVTLDNFTFTGTLADAINIILPEPFVNTPPVAVPDTLATDEDTTLTISADDVLGNDSDADGDSLTIMGLANVVGGSVGFGDNGGLVFTPTPDFNGVASFDTTISDGNGGTATSTVTVNVAPINDDPTVGAALAVTAAEDDAAFTLDLLAGAEDVDGDVLSAANFSDLPAGLSLDGSVLTIDPAAEAFQSLGVGESEVIEVGFDIVDGNGGSVAQTVSVTITGTNDAPVAVADTATTDEDAPVTIAAAALLANDSDVDGDDLTIIALDNAVNGSVAFDDAGDILFTPDADFSGDASFDYTVFDDNGGTATASVAVTVNEVADPEPPADDIVAVATVDDAFDGSLAETLASGIALNQDFAFGIGDTAEAGSVIDAALVAAFSSPDTLPDLLDAVSDIDLTVPLSFSNGVAVSELEFLVATSSFLDGVDAQIDDGIVTIEVMNAGEVDIFSFDIGLV